ALSLLNCGCQQGVHGKVAGRVWCNVIGAQPWKIIAVPSKITTPSGQRSPIVSHYGISRKRHSSKRRISRQHPEVNLPRELIDWGNEVIEVGEIQEAGKLCGDDHGYVCCCGFLDHLYDLF